MLMKDANQDTLVKVVKPNDLIDPNRATVHACRQAGEEEQPPEDFAKAQLVFPSGEKLPRCWVDPSYR
jgi:hypothetical protein